MTPSGGSNGRIDTVAAAREALHVSTDQLPVGVPGPVLVACLVKDEGEPDVVADFAQSFLVNEQSRLYDRTHDRMSRRRLPNAWWIVFGSIVEASDRSLVLGRLTVSPATSHDLAHPDGEIFTGVSATLLRLVSPTRLLADAVEYLRRTEYLLERFGAEVSEAQQKAQRRVAKGRVPQSRISDDQIESIARRYVTLYRRGTRRGLLAQLGREYGLTPEQARDRIHRARQIGFLMPSKQGRISADPGPRLPESTLWQSPKPEGDTNGQTA